MLRHGVCEPERVAQVYDIQALFRELLRHRKEARHAAEAGTQAMAKGKRAKARAELRKAERAMAAAGKIEQQLNPTAVYDSRRPPPRRHK